MTSDCMDDRQGEAMKPSPSPAATSGNNMDNFTDDASPKAGVTDGSGAVGRVVPGEGRYLATLWRRVDVGDGAFMACPAGELEWQLRYGNPTWVRFITASVVESYAYLLSEEINFREATRRLRLLRRAQRYTNPTPPLQVGTPAQAESPGDEVQKGKP